MKKIILGSFVVLMTIGAQDMQAQKGKSKGTQLIDREIFFGNPEISGGQLSPDGQWISFMKEYEGIMNIWVKRFDEPFDKAVPLTNSKRPMMGYFWTYDGKYIVYAKDENGDENINVFAVDPMAKAAEAGGVPASRNLTPLKDVTAQINMVSKKNPDVMMVALNDRDKAWHDLYQLQISTGELTKVFENHDRITGYDFDWDEKLRVVYKTDEKGNTIMFSKEGETLKPLYDFIVTEQAYIAGWTPDNKQAYLVSNKGDLNLSTLHLMDVATKNITKLESDPKNRVDFGGLSLSDLTHEILYTSYTDDKTDIVWKNKTWEANYKYLKSKFPGREVDIASVTKDEKKFLIAISGDKYASEVYFYDVDTKELKLQYIPRPKLKAVEKDLAEMKSVRYKSSDGLEIPAYLTLPVGVPAKNLPVVVLVHGGPKGPRDYWGFNSYAQFLANRGYAVLQPNFRASGGYGKKFLNAGDLQWGKLMQDDITWGVKYLVSQGIANKDKVAIMGGSYGGYATLAGLAFTPDLYACGVDIVGPSNIFTLLESIPAYWEAGRAMLYGMCGDPNTEAGKQRIREASPLFSADKIVKPLLIVQGANDPRVKQAEADQIVIALRDKGKKVSYLLADDEGHGFRKPVNNQAMFAETERFLSGILGGRYQDGMPQDVAERLMQLKVDINTVKYEPKKDFKITKELPAIAANLKPQTINYDFKIELQGQALPPMTMTRTISQKGANWIVKDVSKGAMGEMSDEAEFSPSFAIANRSMSQMGQSISMSFAKEKMTMNAAGQQMEVPFTGAYLSDGAGLDMIVAGLPLAKDYSLAFEMPDVMTGKAKQVTLKVVGNEKINNIDCFKCEIVSNDNANDITTLWINPSSKMAEKMIQVLPAMGNAKLTIDKK
ncbi:S9 family peptidase [Flavobacterium caeni]|uniref:Dipeptidyl aminopeptidase/acylaminoacyl peptidase n=1 Tax=Flavobacterium caeni TaxID=490189 RepID=A0A1G5HNE9_9FLAO|nr:S9 family peptidase [Flavobacterium caeni]SCY65224.1 Dipeptidyl aminopeptidase/acylaminoacyl peptidase [Flavobacterium caeni]